MTTLGSIHSAVIKAYAPQDIAATGDEPHSVIYRQGEGLGCTYTILSPERVQEGKIPAGCTRLTLNEIVDLLQTTVVTDPNIDPNTQQSCAELLGKMGQRKMTKAEYGASFLGCIREFLSKLQNLFSGYGFQTSAERAFALQATLAPAPKKAPAAAPTSLTVVPASESVPSTGEPLTKDVMRQYAGLYHIDKSDVEKTYQPAMDEVNGLDETVVEEIRTLAHNIGEVVSGEEATLKTFSHYRVLKSEFTGQTQLDIEMINKSGGKPATVATVIAIVRGYLENSLKINIKSQSGETLLI